MALWLGIMNIAKKSGLLDRISKLFYPLFSKLFPEIPKGHESIGLVTSNMIANMFGLGNAATPLGLEAMKRLQENSLKKDTATDEMVRFVVLNSAALHLVPTTVALLRHEYGSSNPMEILIPSIFTSFLSVSIGVLMTFLLRKVFKV